MKEQDQLPIVSVSGGKDSTAVYILAVQAFGKNGFKAVFADTGNEHPVTVNYVRNLHVIADGPVVEIVERDYSKIVENPSGNPFEDMLKHKGRAPSARAQWCTENLKLHPIRKWLDNLKTNLEPCMYVGIRAGESARRSKMTAQGWNDYYDCPYSYPLFYSSEQDVWDVLEWAGVPPNPLYGKGIKRVGCFPCIHARKSELAAMPDWAWEKLAKWERMMGSTFFAAGKIPGNVMPHANRVREWATRGESSGQTSIEPIEKKDPPPCLSAWGYCE